MRTATQQVQPGSESAAAGGFVDPSNEMGTSVWRYRQASNRSRDERRHPPSPPPLPGPGFPFSPQAATSECSGVCGADTAVTAVVNVQ